MFARLADVAGSREIEIEAGEGLRVSDIIGLLAERHPAMGEVPAVRFAVNAEYVTPDHPLRAGDEVALIPPVSGGDMLLEITPDPLHPERLTDHVTTDEAGAVVLFHGVVRDNNLGRRVLYLEYDAYPEMATKVMRRIAGEIQQAHGILEIAIQHRTGRLEIGELSLLVAVSAAHRREAIEGCHALVDRFKEEVPIWKKEVFEGGEEWIGGDLSPRQI